MIKSIAARLNAWRLERETVRELSMLSNRELADLGIGRGDIPFVAAGTLYRVDSPAAALAATAADDLIGPDWAAHAPTSLAA